MAQETGLPSEKSAIRRLLEKIKKALTSQRSLDLGLIEAAKKGDLVKIEALLARGASPLFQAKTYNKETALFSAVDNGHAEAVTALLRAGAPADIQLDYGATTLLINAVKKKNADVARALVQGGAGIDYRAEEYGRTPLHEALHNKNAAMAALLLDLGADLSACDGEGCMPLVYAIGRGDAAAVQSLLDKGARADIVNNKMESALDLAREYQQPALFGLLQAHLDAKVEPWQVQGDQEIAAVTLNRVLGFKLTQIFNFEKQRVTTVTQDLVSGAISPAFIVDFVKAQNASEIEEARVKLAEKKQAKAEVQP